MVSHVQRPFIPQKGLFITGTDTDAGKTFITASLLRTLLQSDYPAIAVKPVQTGVTGNFPGDISTYREATGDLSGNWPDPQILYAFRMASSPHLAARMEGKTLTVKGLLGRIGDLDDTYPDIFKIFEGAGGLHVPLNEKEDILDLIREMDLPVLLVCANRLGGLNHALQSIETLASNGLRLHSVVLNDCFFPADADTRAILEDNEKMLRARLGHQDCKAVFIRMNFMSGPNAWNMAARKLLPVAKAIMAATDWAGGEEIVRKDYHSVWHPYASATKLPCLHVAERSHGNRIVLRDGRELVDGMSSWWAACHGYNHPALIRALRHQAGRMPHVMFGGLTHEPAVNLAEKLRAVLPAGLERIFFADSGSVAVEVALKMAFQYHAAKGDSKRKFFLTPRGGYHGDTMGGMSLSDPQNSMHSLFSTYLPRQIFAERPECPFSRPFEPGCMDSLREIFSRSGTELAAFVLEPVVQGAGGMWFYHPRYLDEVRKLCDETGALLIYDEIATGFGRTGHYFATEWTASANPDILCCGKALTGGMMTLSATACTAKVAEGICSSGMPFMHGPTFMANPLACAVAGASMDLLARNRWQAQIKTLASIMTNGLEECRHMAGVADVRVLGGIGVVEMDSPVNMEKLQKFFVRRGVWLRPFNRLVYMMPPYISPPEDVKKLCAAIRDAISTGEWQI